jgi:hypothetical protein
MGIHLPASGDDGGDGVRKRRHRRKKRSSASSAVPTGQQVMTPEDEHALLGTVSGLGTV